MSEPLDDVAFLTRSPNRVAVARTLADGPRSRRELVAETDGSRVTVGRILHDFEERGWVERPDAAYELTTRGRLVVQGLLTVLDRLRAVERLDPVLPWFEADRLGVSVEAFVDAETTAPTETEPNRHHQRIGTLGATATSARMYSHGVTSEALGIHLAAAADGQRLTLLVTQEVVDAVREDPGLRADFGALVGTDAFVGTVDESLPVPFLGLFDGRCVVGVVDDRSRPVGIVESAADEVVAWAERTLDALAADATAVDPDLFTP
jgi:predicted transcriptional regulator